MKILLSKLPTLQKILFLSIFAASGLIRFLHWDHYRSSLGLPTHFPMIFWEYVALLALLIWNPKGIRWVLLAVLGFLICELILYNFFVGSMSKLPYWYLFRDVYRFLHADSFIAFFVESVLLLIMTISLFPGKKSTLENELLDDLK